MTPDPGGYQSAPHPFVANPLRPQHVNWIGTTAFVVGMVGLVLCWSVAGGVLCGVLAVVLGVVGRRRAKNGQATNGPVASAGVALGLVAVAVSLAIIPLWLRMFREVDVPAYADCVAKTSDPAAVQKCIDEFGRRVNTELGVKDASKA